MISTHYFHNRLFLIAISLLFFAASCEKPTEPEGNIPINVIYNKPPSTNISNGIRTFSSVASITWNGGNTTVVNQKQSTTIYVPKGASLKATYTDSFYNNHDGSVTNKQITKTFTASSGTTWTL